MQFVLKNGSKLEIREAQPDDAVALCRVMETADRQTRFLGRNPGEFCATPERERHLIEEVLVDADQVWMVAEYRGQVVGQCSVARVRRTQRFRHRAEVAFVLLQEFWGLGIGGKMMQSCIDWCHAQGIEQMELQVVTKNERALRMYRGFGFEICGTLPNALAYADGSYAAEYFMVKRLR